MTNEEAIKVIETIDGLLIGEGYDWEHEGLRLAKEALKKQSDTDCSRCRDRDKCAIHDNFNIDYCSDWSENND
jgi:hypothetical protein